MVYVHGGGIGEETRRLHMMLMVHQLRAVMAVPVATSVANHFSSLFGFNGVGVTPVAVRMHCHMARVVLGGIAVLVVAVLVMVVIAECRRHQLRHGGREHEQCCKTTYAPGGATGSWTNHCR